MDELGSHLVHVDTKKPLKLATDASSNGVGAITLH